MRAPALFVDTWDSTARLGFASIAARILIAVGAVIGMVAAGAAGDHAGPLPVLTVAVTAWAVARPDSAGPLALICLLILGWLAAVDGVPLRPSIVLGLSILVVHVCAARAAAMAEGAAVTRRVVLRWCAGSVAVAALTALLWIVVMLLESARPPGTLAVAVLAVAAVAGLAAAARA